PTAGRGVSDAHVPPTPFQGVPPRAPTSRVELTAALGVDLQAEAVEVDVLALLGLADAAAVQADADERPQARGRAGVVVAVGVRVALQQPAPRTLFAAGLRLLLPALEHAGDRLQ